MCQQVARRSGTGCMRRPGDSRRHDVELGLTSSALSRRVLIVITACSILCSGWFAVMSSLDWSVARVCRRARSSGRVDWRSMC